MKISSTALRAKRSCASGYRWFARHFDNPAEYQRVLDALVVDGRVDDACWLLDHFGPVAAVRVVDSISALALVFAGSLEVRGDLRCGAALSAGGNADIEHDLEVNGPVRAGKSLRVGGSIVGSDGLQVQHGLRSGGSIRSGLHIDAGWGIVAGSDIVAEGAIRAGECVVSAGDIEVGEGHGVYAGLSARRDAWPSSGQVRSKSPPVGLMSGLWVG